MRCGKPTLQSIFFREVREKGRSRKSGPPIPEWRRVAAVSGADFDGLVQPARVSIGLFLLQATIISEFRFQNDKFFDFI